LLSEYEQPQVQALVRVREQSIDFLFETFKDSFRFCERISLLAVEFVSWLNVWQFELTETPDLLHHVEASLDSADCDGVPW
jgi:hypothetical protein